MSWTKTGTHWPGRICGRKTCRPATVPIFYYGVSFPWQWAIVFGSLVCNLGKQGCIKSVRSRRDHVLGHLHLQMGSRLVVNCCRLLRYSKNVILFGLIKKYSLLFNFYRLLYEGVMTASGERLYGRVQKLSVYRFSTISLD